MLSPLDETLAHQASVPFRMAAVSDHRFFDRYWFEAVDPSGAIGLIAGLAFYKNMGTCDGFVSVQADQNQHNLRVAQPLGDDLEASAGPLSIEVIEPFRHIRLHLRRNAHGMEAELDWTSNWPPYTEEHHRVVRAGRTTTDSTRYDQVGSWHGWIQIGGARHDVDQWWGVRDHSWGVRPGVGGFEPSGPAVPSSLLHCWACFSTPSFTCQFQLQEDGDGNRLLFDGQLDWPLGDARVAIRAVDVSHQISFVPGTRVYDRARFQLRMADGRELAIDARPLLRPWAYRGTGYNGGYDDGMGLGAWRGTVLEHDVYDLSDLETVRLDGHPHRAGHREQPVRVTVDGEEGIGHLPVMVIGSLPSYGLT
jgi:hypothetical protein